MVLLRARRGNREPSEVLGVDVGRISTLAERCTRELCKKTRRPRPLIKNATYVPQPERYPYRISLDRENQDSSIGVCIYFLRTIVEEVDYGAAPSTPCG